MNCQRCAVAAPADRPHLPIWICFNCFIGRPFETGGRCRTCGPQVPRLVRQYLSGVFCDDHAPGPAPAPAN